MDIQGQVAADEAWSVSWDGCLWLAKGWMHTETADDQNGGFLVAGHSEERVEGGKTAKQ